MIYALYIEQKITIFALYTVSVFTTDYYSIFYR